MLTVIIVKTPSSHLSIMKNECCNEVDSAMTDILKLTSLYHPRNHQFCRTSPLQSLQVGFFVQADDNCSHIMQLVNVLVTPKNATCTTPELLIQDWRFPIPTAMGLQIRCLQDQGDCRVRYLWNYSPFCHYLRQSSC